MNRSEEYLRRRLADHLLRLLATPSEVPVGAHEIDPGDPRIVAAVDEVVLPMIEQLEPDEIRRHPDGDLLARFGPSGDDGLLIQTYIVSQHGNLMADPHDARLEDGDAHGLSGPVARGQGANQNKGPMAAVLTALAMRPADLVRPVLLAVNTEGRSSHGGSQRIVDDLGARARWGIIAISTGLKVSLGNRGRADIRIGIRGASCHSSQPWLGVNPIDHAADVVAALRDCALPEPHPELGSASLTPYHLVFEPLAPHTVPEQGKLIVDRRLLPGEEPGQAAAALAEQLGQLTPHQIDVSLGAVMLPAEVPPDASIVTALVANLDRVTGRSGETMHSRNTFDAGYGCSRGIPTVMFGPGVRSFGHGLVADEVVSIEDCWTTARVLDGVVRDICR